MKIYNLIFEEKEEDREPEKGEGIKVGKKTRLAKDSLDDQIDSLLIKYEMESIIDDEGHAERSLDRTRGTRPSSRRG
jgi:aspartokinase-like uncharacterized kinase